MFWQYEKWSNAFIIQLIAIIIAIIVGKKNKVRNSDLFLSISLVCPVALFLVSAGVAGAIFLSDFAAIYLLFRKNNPIKRKYIILIAFALFLLWPIISTLISNISATITGAYFKLDIKILLIQIFRYFLYFILFAKLISKPYENYGYLIKMFKVQSIMFLFIFISILLGYLNIIKVDAWNELIKFDAFGPIGIGGMFLYRGGVATLGAISIPIIYLCIIYSKGLYKYMMVFLLFVVMADVIFSGSRQGVVFSVFSLILVILLFKQLKIATQIFAVGIVIIIFLLQFDSIRQTKAWIFNRYNLLLIQNDKLTSEIKTRNFYIDDAQKQAKDDKDEIIGLGLGGKIISTESDYYNSYLYFGMAGLSIYILFILYNIKKIYFKWKNTTVIFIRHILVVMLIVSLITPLFGFQQWFLMTFGSNNTINVYLTLFIFAITLNYPNYKSNSIQVQP